MDILTPKGQMSLTHEHQMAEWFQDRFGVDWIETPKDKPASVDAIITKGNVIEGVAEVKCRYGVTLESFRNTFQSQWLVTWEKINRLMSCAQMLGVCGVGILYMPETRYVLIQRLCDPDGKLCVDIRLSTTDTQATINGGIATRTNAFVDMTDAKPYHIPI